ncbi:hypothetical protein SAMN05192529_10299 [Arachidicoccus rhizosphaerae]|uniref:Uncharacterized protein n=1 Tax=Arachidicoccus rhizosphaerae TaxID=551991 RepID=A0A1H3W3L8_9BACT|nr:hypothetical protein [Arachidicoccus rhizosphaerae]SDZ81590.1 hypothetical protein SAMN05192529_10299 [Arachidicoccus rhizosphaerae]
MEQIISNYGMFALLLIIVAIVYIEARHNPKMMQRTAEITAADRTSVLIANIKSQKRMIDLKNMLVEIRATCLYNKATTRHAEELNRKIWDEYHGQRYYLICTEHPEVPQSLLPFLTN